ncbi:TPA: hypothetical protein RG697_003853 [Morganella morganii]|nr:hypothetical protein [Morganella morganii]
MATELISSTELEFISVETNNLSFHRDDSISEDFSISLEISVSIAERADGENQCKISMQVELIGAEKESRNENERGAESFRLDLTVDYIFDITNRESFDSFSDEDKITTLSNVVYLDFRQRIIASMASIGATKFGMPLSLRKIQK